ncbi:MAG: alpha/beta fold hydrolase [Clostridia bacterium]|nr:alpha/beta fold hydrolase [Clostridia bacterium]
MIWAVIVIASLLLALLGGAYYAYRRTFGKTKRMQDPDPLSFIRDPRGSADYEGHKKRVEAASAVPYERVFIRSGDGLRLSARFYEGEEGAPVVIFFHGYRSNAIHDGCGLHAVARSLGYRILLCDQRAHGESEGRCLTFGVKERLDAKCWAEYAAERFPDAPIFLSGISMGAATVLMAASLPMPRTVVGVLADCPYSSPREIIMKVVGEMGLPPRLMYPLIRLGALLYGGFDPNETDAVRSVRMKTPPLLIVHGTADGFVPSEMSSKIDAAAVGEHTLVLVDGADHGKSFTVAPELYVKTLNDFFDACLKNGKGWNG